MKPKIATALLAKLLDTLQIPHVAVLLGTLGVATLATVAFVTHLLVTR